MAWISLPSVSVANGDITVSVTGSKDLSGVLSGWALIINNNYVEIKSGTSADSGGNSTLTLAEPWDGSTITNQPAKIMPTSAPQLEIAQLMTDTNDYAIDVHNTLAEIATLDKDVTIKDPTGEEHTFATMPKSARLVQEAIDQSAEGVNSLNVSIAYLQEQIDSNQANIDWDVEIPFSDSLNIAKGYGTHDQVDVSAAQDESIMVDLPTKSVDFSRASASGGFNKSGVYEEAQEDEPVIVSDGLYLAGKGYTVAGIDSKNVADWGSIVTEIGTYKGQPVFSITADENSAGNISHPPVYFDDFGVSQGDILTISCFYRSDNSARFKMEPYVYTPTIIASYSPIGVVTASSEFEEKVFKVVVPDTSIYTYFRFQFVRFASSYGTEAGDEVHFTMPMITAGDKKYPFQSVGSTTEVRASDVASIPMKNNFPAAGEPFTIVADIGIYDESPVYSRGLFGNLTGGSKFGVYVNQEHLLRLRVNTSVYSFTNPSYNMANDRFILRYDGNVVDTFINGVLIDSATVGEIKFNYDESLFFGREFVSPSQSYANGSFKNFRIAHRALSGAEIAALGSPK